MPRDIFHPLSDLEREERLRAFGEFLKVRDGAPDLAKRTLSGREEQLQRFQEAQSLYPGVVDRALFEAQYRRFDKRVPAPKEMLLLLTFVKFNNTEAYTVEKSFIALEQGLVTPKSELEIFVLLEEHYHTKILLSAAHLFGLKVEPRKGRGNMLGRNLSYVDLSIFQLIAGLRYAFPKTMRGLEPKYPGLVALHDKVAARPNIGPLAAPINRSITARDRLSGRLSPVSQEDKGPGSSQSISASSSSVRPRCIRRSHNRSASEHAGNLTGGFIFPSPLTALAPLLEKRQGRCFESVLVLCGLF